MTQDPANPYLQRATLSGGLRVALRPLRRSDREAVASGFRHLSADSRLARFLEPMPRLPDHDLDLLLASQPEDERLALALVWPRNSCADVLIGVGRAIRLPDRPDTADVGVVVADEIQGQGAGRLIVRALADAALALGLTRFTGVLLPANEASARMLASVGTVESDTVSQGQREMTVLLRPAGPARP